MADELRKKLVLLAKRVEGKDVSQLLAIRIELQAQRVDDATKTKVRKVLAESLSTTDSDVLVKLASFDDSDRILDDIVDILNDDD